MNLVLVSVWFSLVWFGLGYLRDEGGVPGVPLLPGKALSLHTQLLLQLDLGSNLVTS